LQHLEKVPPMWHPCRQQWCNGERGTHDEQ
jgi:hypothetical protein